MNRSIKLEPESGSTNSTESDHSRRSSLSASLAANDPNKICRVCGDRALSINFNVVTCESCKAFFRRNALKPKEFRCPFNGSCEITMVSRKFCKKCRLRKCFEVGMMKEWIMSDEARIQKRHLIETNREKRRRLDVEPIPPAKIRRKSSKLEIFDSPPATSSSTSSDERLDTPSTMSNTNTASTSYRPILGTSSAISTTRSIIGQDPPPNPTGESSGAGLLGGGVTNTSGSGSDSTADSIVIPKSVLLNLINRCQQNSQNACPHCPPPPVLTRALKLYEVGGLDGLDGADDQAALELLSKCICSCACGANSQSDNKDEEMNEEATTRRSIDNSSVATSTPLVDVLGHHGEGMTNTQRQLDLDQAAGTSAFRPLDYNRDIYHPDHHGHPSYLGGQGASSSGLHLGLGANSSTSATPPAASSSIFASFPGQPDPSLMNGQEYQELLKIRRALMDGLAAELGYGGSDPLQHTKYVISNPMEVVKATHSYVMRIIEVNKMLSTFRSLTTADQAALLQGGIRELTMLISAGNYNHEIDGWQVFGRNQPYIMRPEILNGLNTGIFEQHINFIRSFAPQWSSDEILMQLMAAICLFDQDRPGIVDRQGVLRQREFYCGLMKDYLMNLYGQQEGLRIFDELLNRLEWLRRGVDRMWPSYQLELSPQDLRPLMADMLI